MQCTEGHVTEPELQHWDLLRGFAQGVDAVFSSAVLHRSLEDPARTLSHQSYLSLFLFGLVNPAVQSMRGLCALTRLERVQRAVGRGPVSPTSFSEMQHLVDPELLRQVFGRLVRQLPGNPRADARLARLNLIAQDGSLWRALPRMAWAEYGGGRAGDAKAVRLHLRFHVTEDQPVDARIGRGRDCERQALRQMGGPGETSVGDRFYGEDYRLFGEVDQAGGFFVIRIKEDAVVNLEEALPLSAEDCAAGVVRQAWVRLGAREKTRSMRLRLVEIRAGDQHLLLVTNLTVDQASAALVGLIYRRRWSIEQFFRWVKCILECRHFFAESPEGVALQLYLALIAAVLLQQVTGRRPGRREMELIQMYLLGWASAEELGALRQQPIAPREARQKT